MRRRGDLGPLPRRQHHIRCLETRKTGHCGPCTAGPALRAACGAKEDHRAWHRPQVGKAGATVRRRRRGGGHQPAGHRVQQRQPLLCQPRPGLRVGPGARGGPREGLEDHPGERQPGRRPLGRHQRHRRQGQAGQRHRAYRRRRRLGQPGRRRQDLAQRAEPERVAELHGHRHRHRARRREDHHDEHLPHPGARADIPRPDLRGVPPDLRRRHADPLDVQPAGHEQGGGRAVARAHHVQAGDRRLVLGRRRAPVLPAAGLLAGRHHGQLHRPPERGGRAPRACTAPPT